jgi:ATP-dependent RNA helicase RhlE
MRRIYLSRFQSLGLLAELNRALTKEGYAEPTPIQERAIPLVLEGRDVMAAAQTGTGKTAAFALPILHRLSYARSSQPKALILVPTRELALQVEASFRTYGRFLRTRTAVIYGGVSIIEQIERLKRGVDVIVATPGRLLDHVQRRTVKLSGIEQLVLDEADRMLDMGFIPDIRRILPLLPDRRQTLMFSATLNTEIRGLANGLLQNPALIEIAPERVEVEQIVQRVHPVDKARKTDLVSYLVKMGDLRQVLIFTATKRGAERLAWQLANEGFSTTAIHGDKTQAARSRALKDFKGGKVRLLVATDVASRGLDIQRLPCVINYELPNTPEDYVHRIGRTGRAGHSGEAISLVSESEVIKLKEIQRLLRHDIPSVTIDGFEPSFRPTQGRSRGHGLSFAPSSRGFGYIRREGRSRGSF